MPRAVRSSTFLAVIRSAASRALRRATSSRKRLDRRVDRPVMNWGRLPGMRLGDLDPAAVGVVEVQQSRSAAQVGGERAQSDPFRFGDVHHGHSRFRQTEIARVHGRSVILCADNGAAFCSPHTATLSGDRAGSRKPPRVSPYWATRRVISASSERRSVRGRACRAQAVRRGAVLRSRPSIGHEPLLHSRGADGPVPRWLRAGRRTARARQDGRMTAAPSTRFLLHPSPIGDMLIVTTDEGIVTLHPLRDPLEVELERLSRCSARRARSLRR